MAIIVLVLSLESLFRMYATPSAPLFRPPSLPCLRDCLSAMTEVEAVFPKAARLPIHCLTSETIPPKVLFRV